MRRKHRKIVPNLSAVQIEEFNKVYAVLVPPGEVIVLISPGKKPYILDEPPQKEPAIFRIGIQCEGEGAPSAPVYAVTVKPDLAEEMRARFIDVDHVVDEESLQVMN